MKILKIGDLAETTEQLYDFKGDARGYRIGTRGFVSDIKKNKKGEDVYWFIPLEFAHTTDGEEYYSYDLSIGSYYRRNELKKCKVYWEEEDE